MSLLVLLFVHFEFCLFKYLAARVVHYELDLHLKCDAWKNLFLDCEFFQVQAVVEKTKDVFSVAISMPANHDSADTCSIQW
jgi:hypothetical protein